MKSALYEPARRLATLALLAACADFLLPRGEMRKYARFVAGLALLEVLITPLARFLAGVI